MPLALFHSSECMQRLVVNINRASEGYQNTYFDILEDDGSLTDVWMKLPAKSGDLYFMAETYSKDIV
jgi:hypothetical protein